MVAGTERKYKFPSEELAALGLTFILCPCCQTQFRPGSKIDSHKHDCQLNVYLAKLSLREHVVESYSKKSNG